MGKNYTSFMHNELFIVYKHTSPSNKVYIGITKQKTYKRWRGGCGYLHNMFFKAAINKYGWSNFKHEILYENLSQEEAMQLEIQLIAEYNSTNHKCGYNITKGGDLRGPVTELTRKKLSDSHKNIHPSEESLRKRSETMKKYLQTPEAKEKWRKANKGRKFSEETKNKISEALKGHSVLDITKAKVRDKKIKLIIQLDKNKNPMCVWKGRQEIQDTINYNAVTIAKVCKKNQTTIKHLHKDYYFVYLDDYLQNN